MTDKDKPIVGTTTDAPGAPDSHLRDARLAQALQHMPDAHMQAGAQARLAVLQHAQEAIASTPRPADRAAPKARRWWQWLLGTTGRQRTSHTAWGGAVASVLVASVITLMWYDQPVPDANPDMPTSMGKAESAAPATSTSTAASTAPSPAAATAAAAATAPQRTAPASPHAAQQATAPTADMAQAKRSEPSVTAPRKQDEMKESRKAVTSNGAEAPPPVQSAPPAEVQAAAPPPPPPPPPPAPAAMIAVPAPAPAPAPPSTAYAQRSASTGSVLADAAPAARARGNMPLAKMSPATAPPPTSPTATSKPRSDVIHIQSGTRTRSVPAHQADALLAYLRELRGQHAISLQAAGQLAEPTAQLAADIGAPTITLRTAQGELWEIWPTQVRVQDAQFFAINPLQYETLRKLIAHATAP